MGASSEPARASSRRRARWGLALADVSEWCVQRGEVITKVGLALVVFGSAVGIGGVHVEVLLAVAAVALLALLAASRATEFRTSPISWVALLLAAYSLVQSLPLPFAVVSQLSPAAGQVWARALEPFREPSPAWVSLSIDPGASRVEALKWGTYAIVATLAANAGRRQRYWVPLLVALSATLVAAITLAHWLLSLESLYGWYRPRGAGIISPFINANNLAGYLNLGFFSGVACLLGMRIPLLRWVLPSCLAGIYAVSALLASRAGLISMSLGTLVFATGMAIKYLRGRRRMAPADGILVATSAIAGGAGLIWVTMDPSTLKRLLAEETVKLDLISWTPPMVRDFAWFGAGRGAFETAFPPYQSGYGRGVFAHAENFVLQWAAEWGVSITVLALAWFTKLLWRDSGRAWARSATATVILGICVLLFHNLFDLALEVPGVSIALAALLGFLVPGSAAKRAPEPGGTRILAPPIGMVPAVFLFFLAAAAAGPSIGEDRDALYARLSDLSPQAKPWADFRKQLREAVLRHPGDPYLFFLGSAASHRFGVDAPLTWASRALERDPRDAQTHLLVADVLAARGGFKQALLHLRFATDYDAQAFGVAAPRAIAWSEGYDDLVATAPEGASASNYLVELAGKVGGEKARFKVPLLQEAVRRGPDNEWAHRFLSYALLGLLEDENLGPCDNACRRQLERSIEKLRALSPEATTWRELRALMLAATGAPDQALDLLEGACHSGAPDSCYGTWLKLAERHASHERLGRALEAYVAVACIDTERCAAAKARVGATLERKGQLALALQYYDAAAEEHPSYEAWARVAQLAQKLGISSVRVRALRNAARSRQEGHTGHSGDAELDAQYRELLRESSASP